MRFRSISELVEIAEKENKKIYEIMIEEECKFNSLSKEEAFDIMQKRFEVMKEAKEKGVQGVMSKSGMTGMGSKMIFDYISCGKFITDETFLKAICYSIATNEVNASMGLICATPTAGSAGVLPGVLFSIKEKYDFSDEEIINHMFTAGAIGYVIANNASISGATGGCQAEIGTASAMAAGSLTEIMGGTPKQCGSAVAIALKNMLGLTCDPVAGLVEAPCIKRNAAGAANAILASEMALAGMESVIPVDEVIESMYNIGIAMPVALRETSMGGLAMTKTGMLWKEKLS